jgi:hypothetical protein
MDDLARPESGIFEPIAGKMEYWDFAGNMVILSLPIPGMKLNNTN